MKHYKLRYVMHDPSEETEDKYLAEIPGLPGCRLRETHLKKRWTSLPASPPQPSRSA